MRALVVSDIHGNLQALQAVLAASGAYDQLWNLGDVVGYGGNPNEVIEILRSSAVVNVRGNHDRVAAGLTSSHGFNPVAAQAAAWTRATLTSENLHWLQQVSKGPVQASAGTLAAHGSPLDEDHYILSMRDAWTPLQRMAASVTFFGHTHVQGAFLQNGAEWEEVRPACAEDGSCRVALTEATRMLGNPGSVGQPRDHDPRAGFALYDDEAGTILFRRVVYDLAGAQSAIRVAGLPDRLATRLETGR